MRTALGITRSLATYYGRPIRLARLIRFYRQLLPEDGLYFDIGAHVGHRVWAARKAGARVVAVEPQPSCQRVLKWLFDGDGDVALDARPIAEQPGHVTLHVSPRHPTVTSISRRWVDTVSQTAGFRHVRWTDRISMVATTVDALIDQYGCPDFCKIDIEGGEPEALAGLSHPIGLISVERLPAAQNAFEASLSALERLGDYRFNWCRGETPGFASAAWLTGSDLRDRLSLERGVCDVFAALDDSPARLDRNSRKT